MAALPTHPTLTHPRTGKPLRAVFVSERTGRAYWPIIGAEDPPADPPKADPPKVDPPPEPTFPANTPVAQMNDAQQAAYWKHYARQHEDRAKAFGDLTPETLTSLREKAERHDALEAEMASDADKAATQAKKDAEDAKDAHYQPMLAETAFRVAIGTRKTEAEVSDFIADLNLSRFLTTDGKVDTAKVLARVEQFAPATGTQHTPKGPTVTGHGPNGGGGGGLSGLSGSELYDRLHPKKTASAT